MNPLNRLATLIGDAIDSSDLTEREVEAITGIPRTTMKRRLEKPGAFTLDELEDVARFMDTDVEALIATAHGRVTA